MIAFARWKCAVARCVVHVVNAQRRDYDAGDGTKREIRLLRDSHENGRETETHRGPGGQQEPEEPPCLERYVYEVERPHDDDACAEQKRRPLLFWRAPDRFYRHKQRDDAD